MLPFALRITGRRLFTNFHCMGKFRACAHRNYELAYYNSGLNFEILHEVLHPNAVVISTEHSINVIIIASVHLYQLVN